MHACIHKYIHQYIRWYIKNYAKIMCEHNASGRGSLEEKQFCPCFAIWGHALTRRKNATTDCRWILVGWWKAKRCWWYPWDMLEYPQPSNVRGKIVFVPKNKRTKCGNANCFFEVHSFHSLKRLGLSWNHYLVFQRQHLAIQLPSRFRVPVRNGNSMCNHGAISSDHHGTMERWYTSIAQSRWKSFSLSR